MPNNSFNFSDKLALELFVATATNNIGKPIAIPREVLNALEKLVKNKKAPNGAFKLNYKLQLKD